MDFRTYLRRYVRQDPSHTQSRLANLFSDSAGIQFTANIWSECRLPSGCWQQIYNLIHGGTTAAGQLKQDIALVFRGFPWAGGPAGVLVNTVFARVNRKSDLAAAWASLYNISSRDARDLIDHIIINGHGVLGNSKVAQYPMWATFNLSNPTLYPSNTVLAGFNREELACCLGLRPSNYNPNDPDGEYLILFEYTLGSIIQPCVPTIANAYAGSQWHPYFRPNCPEQPAQVYGRTWPTPHVQPMSQPLNALPEVIHEPVLAANLLRVTQV